MSAGASRRSIARRVLIFSHLDAHPVWSGIIIALFIVYLPIVYQLHLNTAAMYVQEDADGYHWGTRGFSLFPFPYFPLPPLTDIIVVVTPLTSIEVYIYTVFYPSIALRVMWSVLWLTIGIAYIIWPLLSSPKTKDAPVSTTLD